MVIFIGITKNYLSESDTFAFALSSKERLFPEKALGEGGDEANFDEEADSGFDSCQSSIGIAQCHILRKEATPVKTAHTEDKGFIPRQVGRDKVSIEQVDTHEAKDDDEVRKNAAYRLIAISCKQPE